MILGDIFVVMSAQTTVSVFRQRPVFWCVNPDGPETNEKNDIMAEMASFGMREALDDTREMGTTPSKTAQDGWPE